MPTIYIPNPSRPVRCVNQIEDVCKECGPPPPYIASFRANFSLDFFTFCSNKLNVRVAIVGEPAGSESFLAGSCLKVRFRSETFLLLLTWI